MNDPYVSFKTPDELISVQMVHEEGQAAMKERNERRGRSGGRTKGGNSGEHCEGDSSHGDG